MKKYIIKLIKNSNTFLNFTALIFSFPTFFRIKGYIKNTLRFKGAFLHKTRIRIEGVNNEIIIAPENRLNNCLLHISGNNCEIQIKNHCILTNLEIWIEDDAGKISIGERTTIEGGHIASTEGKSIIIGDDCMFSHGIEIRNGDSHSIYSFETNERINDAKSVKIDSHVWLGADSKVLKGAEIGEGTIISTSAVVTGIIEKNTIYAGVPARKVKENIYWKRER